MKKEIKHTEITRKEAIKKLGKYAAFTAVGTFAVLNPLRAQETSNPPDPDASRTSGEATIDDSSAPANSSTIQDTQIDKNQVKSNF
ncbi:hypothetical protein [Formosa sp. A9]|uniref:hypothetical protein n=1 Tax=Formosa sp. A9 TaxID=3442641 RepID=UPI003EB83942